MENEDYEAIAFNSVPVENLIDSRKYCDRRKILENKDNFVINGKTRNKIMLLVIIYTYLFVYEFNKMH